MRHSHAGDLLAAIATVVLWGSIFGFGFYQAFFGPPYAPPIPKPTHRHEHCTRYNNQPLLGGGEYYMCEE